MKEVIINKSLNLLNNTYNYDNDTLDRVKYGLELLYISITKIIVILTISLLLGLIKETIITIILFNGLRTYAYGIHAKRSIDCYISSSFIFIVLPFIFTLIEFNVIQKILISILSLISFILYAPADTHKRPLINKKHRKKLKIKTIIVCLIYILILFKTNNTILINLLLLSMILESFVINPWIYKISGMPYNNYKTYQKNNGVNSTNRF